MDNKLKAAFVVVAVLNTTACGSTKINTANISQTFSQKSLTIGGVKMKPFKKSSIYGLTAKFKF